MGKGGERRGAISFWGRQINGNPRMRTNVYPGHPLPTGSPATDSAGPTDLKGNRSWA